MSSVTASAALQDQLEHDLGADVREKQRDESGQRPVDGLPPAPAAEVVAPEEPAEDEPRDEGEHGLVVGLEGLAEELLGEEHPAHHGEREHHESAEEDAKEERFHFEQGRKASDEGR